MSHTASTPHLKQIHRCVNRVKRLETNLSNRLVTTLWRSDAERVAARLSEQQGFFLACLESADVDRPEAVHRCAQELKSGLAHFATIELTSSAGFVTSIDSVSAQVSVETVDTTARFLEAIIECLEQAALYRLKHLNALPLRYVLTLTGLSIVSSDSSEAITAPDMLTCHAVPRAVYAPSLRSSLAADDAS